jgi:hypothetical protein
MTISEQGIANATPNADSPLARRQAYEGLIARLRERVPTLLPPDAKVLVVSRGDDELLRLGTAGAGHFPQADDGRYAGHYPADGAAAVQHLDALQEGGARFLLFPAPAFWWLDHYPEFRDHLRDRHIEVHRDPDFVLFELTSPGQPAEPFSALTTAEQAHWQQVVHLVDALLPADHDIVVIASATVPPVLGGRRVHPVAAAVADGQAIDGKGRPILFAVRDAIRAGHRYLLVPHFSNGPVPAEVTSAIRSRCRVLAQQQELCTVFDAWPRDAVPTRRPGGVHAEA